jgi:hypothetical protein
MKSENRKHVLGKAVSIAAAGLILSIASVALAEDTPVVSSAAPEKTNGLYNALEIGLGVGYTQGVGDVGGGRPSLSDTAGAGGNVELDVGWRINPNWLVGVYGTVATFTTGDAVVNAHNIWSSTAGVQGNYHFLPGESFDPWIGLGAGWRGYWINQDAGQDVRHGLDVARLQVGVDVPVTTGVSISPYAGATATIMLTEQRAGETSFNNIQNPNVHVFFNAGVMGRFDLLGSSPAPVKAASL